MNTQTAIKIASFLLFGLSIGLIAFALFLVSRDGIDSFLPALISGLLGYFLFEYLVNKDVDID